MFSVKNLARKGLMTAAMVNVDAMKTVLIGYTDQVAIKDGSSTTTAMTCSWYFKHGA